MIAQPFAASRPVSTVTISRGPYQSWPEAIRLSNPQCQLVVVSQTGRIMHFSAKESSIENVLWSAKRAATKSARLRQPQSDEFANVGGEKTLPWPQDVWPRAI